MAPVLRPNKGLFLDRPALEVPEGGLSAGTNFRIRDGGITNINLGTNDFGDFTLDGPNTLIYTYQDRGGTTSLTFGDSTALYLYDTSGEDVAYLTPIYVTGTVDVSADAAAVVTDASGSPTWQTAGVKAGDQISFGADDENDPGATWYTIDTVDGETQLTLTGAVSGAPLSGSDYTIRLLFTGDVDNPWEAETFLHSGTGDDDLAIFTNGVDAIVTWDGSAAQVVDAGLGFTARHIAVWRNMLICADFTDSGERYPASIRNSDVGDATDFTSGLSSEFLIHDGTDPITVVEPLGNTLVFYSKAHVVAVDFVGDPFIFELRQVLTTKGCVAGRLLINTGNLHVYVGPDGLYAFDGAQVIEIGRQVFREVLRSRDPNRIGRSISIQDEENGELIFAVAAASDTGVPAEQAWTVHYLEGGPSMLDFQPIGNRVAAWTAAGLFVRNDQLTFDAITDTFAEQGFRWNASYYAGAFPQLLVGDNGGNVYTLNTSNTLDGTAILSSVRTARVATFDGQRRDVVSRVYPFFSKSGADDMTVTVRMADFAYGPITITDAQTFDEGLEEGAYFTAHYRAGRYVEIQFDTPSTTDGYELIGWDFATKPGGRR